MLRSRPLLLLLTAMALIASACGSSATLIPQQSAVDGIPTVQLEASREFVLASAERSQAQTFRFEGSMSMVMDMDIMRIEMSGDEPLMFGSSDGARSHLLMDLGVMFEEMFEGNPALAAGAEPLLEHRDRLQMEVIDDGSGTIYLRAPMFGIPELAAGVPAEFRALAEGWVRVDASAAGFGLDDLGSLTGSTGTMDPAEVLGLLDQIGAEVTASGTENVRGVNTTRLIGRVPLGDLLAAEGADVAGLGFTGSELAALADIEFDIVVNIDDQGLMRRVEFDVDMTSSIKGLSPELFALKEMRMGMTLEFFDYGHTATIEIPDATDLTGPLASFLSAST